MMSAFSWKMSVEQSSRNQFIPHQKLISAFLHDESSSHSYSSTIRRTHPTAFIVLPSTLPQSCRSNIDYDRLSSTVQSSNIANFRNFDQPSADPVFRIRCLVDQKLESSERTGSTTRHYRFGNAKEADDGRWTESGRVDLDLLESNRRPTVVQNNTDRNARLDPCRPIRRIHLLPSARFSVRESNETRDSFECHWRFHVWVLYIRLSKSLATIGRISHVSTTCEERRPSERRKTRILHHMVQFLARTAAILLQQHGNERCERNFARQECSRSSNAKADILREKTRLVRSSDMVLQSGRLLPC